MACKIGSENDDTNDFTERARGGEAGEDSLAYHLSNETEDASLSQLQKMEMRGECGHQKMQMQSIGDAIYPVLKLEGYVVQCTSVVISVLGAIL